MQQVSNAQHIFLNNNQLNKERKGMFIKITILIWLLRKLLIGLEGAFVPALKSTKPDMLKKTVAIPTTKNKKLKRLKYFFRYPSTYSFATIHGFTGNYL